MGFFKGKHKRLAKKYSKQDLLIGYDDCEFELQAASLCGDKKELKRAMKEHRKYEYALLYQNTPAFKRRCKKCK